MRNAAQVLVDGHTCFLDPTDNRAQALLAKGGVLHPESVTLWRSLIRSESWTWVIDVGANYGELALSCSLPEGATLVAIEPNPRVLPFLTASLAGPRPGALILPTAVAATDGEVDLFIDATWSGNTTLAAEWLADRDHEWVQSRVHAMRLSSVFGHVGICNDDRVLVKMDIEGLEADVLQSSIDALMSLTSVALLVEVVRLSAADLDWLTRWFDIYLLRLEDESIVQTPMQTGAELQAQLANGAWYRRDIVLRGPKRTLRAGGRGAA